MQSVLEAFEFVTQPKILISQPLVLNPELLHLMELMAWCAVSEPRCANTNKKARYEYAQRERRQERQHSHEKTLGTHFTSNSYI